MSLKYLQRPFIYREREDIDAFLEESQLWNDIYELYLRVRDNAYNLQVPSVNMFNEVRYQCVRLMLDKHPEENVWANYLNDARDNLGRRYASDIRFSMVYASDLCFSMVYAVLSLLKNPPKQIPRFCNILRDNNLEDEQYYFHSFKDFVKEEKAKGICYDIDLSVMPERPKVIKNAGVQKSTILNGVISESWIPDYGEEWWKTQTKDFDQDTIREVVNLWADKEEKIEIISIIEQAFDLEEQRLEQQKQLAQYSANELPF